MGMSFENSYEVDLYNQRCICIILEISESVINHFHQLEQNQNINKIIVYTLPENVEFLEKNGFDQEGEISHFFFGKDGYILTKYKEDFRKKSTSLEVNKKVMDLVKKDNKVFSNIELGEEFQIQLATKNEIIPLSSLYKKVFRYYPTHVHNPEYINKVISQTYFFVVILHQDKLISAASAIINPKYKNAEITDCATDPDYRGKSLMYHIILEIEKELRKRDIPTFYSLTRAQSFGMNLTVKRLGYQYGGTLINNCIIYSGFEDMNIWTKTGQFF